MTLAWRMSMAPRHESWPFAGMPMTLAGQADGVVVMAKAFT